LNENDEIKEKIKSISGDYNSIYENAENNLLIDDVIFWLWMRIFGGGFLRVDFFVFNLTSGINGFNFVEINF